MAVESKPLFHPEVMRQQIRAFDLPETVVAGQSKLRHWADFIASGRADELKETELLPIFSPTSSAGCSATPARRKRPR